MSFVQASRLGHRQSFLPSIPLGLLSGFLICPLFPLNSVGFFPRNSSAPFVFSPPSMSRLLILRAHMENTWRVHVLNVCINKHNILLCLAYILPTCEVIANERKMTILTRLPSCDCVLIFPRRNQRCRYYASLLQLGLSNYCVAFICNCLFDNAYWQVPSERQRKRIRSWCIWRAMDALCKTVLYCAADVSFFWWPALLHNHASPHQYILRSLPLSLCCFHFNGHVHDFHHYVVKLSRSPQIVPSLS